MERTMERFKVTSSPHIRDVDSVTRLMGDVLLALLPATALAVYLYGLRALLLIVVTVLAAVATEAVCQKLRKQTITINDLSAVVTGLLLALNLPAGAPLWMGALGSIFAIFIVKQVFGGLGENFMNPALAARVFLAVSYPKLMGQYFDPATDALSSATPLALLKEGQMSEMPSMFDSFLGTVSGSIGESSAAALLIGGLYLLFRKVITWEIPVLFIGTVFVGTFLLYGFAAQVALLAILSGGVFLGGFFMATDYATSPIHFNGRIVFALGAGLLTVLIRRFGAYPEGVMFAILLMNAFTPAIEKFTAPKIFGGAK